MPSGKEIEGTVNFDVPSAGKQCSTWYKVFGDPKNGKVPVIILHGGPGACHEYLLNHIWFTENHGNATIFYDQIGNGRSTRLKEKAGDETFWTEELFRNELDNLVDHLGLRETGFDLVGQSWGGMLGSAYASYKPKGLRRLVLFSTPANMKEWVKAQNALRQRLPQEIQNTLKRCEDEGRTDSKEYEEAMGEFYSRFMCKVKPWPAPEVLVALGHLLEDNTVYGTMNGPSETYITGSLRTWQVTDRLHSVEVPVLLINGKDDEAQYNTVVPFFQKLKKVKWYTLDSASHMSHIEQPGQYFQIVSEFLNEVDI